MNNEKIYLRFCHLMSYAILYKDRLMQRMIVSELKEMGMYLDYRR